MKNLKTIAALLFLAITVCSCSKDETRVATPAANPKEYPASVIYQWDGSVRASDFGDNSPATALTWYVKSNGVLEVYNGNQPKINGEWYMVGNVFTCSYTAANGDKLIFQLIKSKTLNMVGFKGLNGESSGSGRVYMFVV